MLPPIYSWQLTGRSDVGEEGRFKDLLSIKSTFTIFDVVAVEPTLLKNITSIFKTKQQERTDIENLVRRNIRAWTHDITTATFEVISKPNELKLFHQTVNKINSQAKVQLIREQLIEKKIDNKEINEELDRLQSLIILILSSKPTTPRAHQESTRSNQQLAYNPCSRIISTETSECKPLCFSLPLSNLASSSLMSTSSQRLSFFKSSGSHPPFDSDSDFNETKRLLLLKSKIANMLIYKPKFGKKWVSKLLKEFISLTTVEEIVAVGAKISTFQAVNLIGQTIKYSDHFWKLVYLIASLKPETFKGVIHGLDKDHLEHLNLLILKSTPETKKFFINAFNLKYKQFFRLACNQLKNEIDKICGDFHDLDRNDLSRIKINEIVDLTDRAVLDKEIINKLPIILRNVKIQSTSKLLFFEDLIKEHQSYVLRLTVHSEKDEYPAGCVWPLLYRTVFSCNEINNDQSSNSISNESSNDLSDDIFDDDCTVDMIFGDWNIVYTNDYRDIGIFAEISDEDLGRAQINGSSVSSHSIAYALLNVVGITTVSSLKHLHIYNRNMLKQYLNRAEIKERIKNEILSMLPPPENT